MLDLGGQNYSNKYAVFVWADNYWVMSHWKAHLEQMMKGLIEEAETWDLEPKPASLWWTSSYTSEEKKSLAIETTTGHHRTPFEEHFLDSWCLLASSEEDARSRGREDATCKHGMGGDVKIYTSKDVPRRERCRRMVEHVYSLFCFGSENGSWSVRLLSKNSEDCKKDLDNDETTISV